MGPFGVSFGGGGGLVVAVLYLILGPGALVYNGGRLALNYYRWRYKSNAFLTKSASDTAWRCLWWNLGITLIPFVLSAWAEWRG